MTLNLDSLDAFKEHFEFEDYEGPLRVVGWDPEIISDLKTLRDIHDFTLCSYDDKRTPLNINDIALAERVFKPYAISGSIMSDIRHAAESTFEEYINDMIDLLEDNRCGYQHIEYLFNNLTGLHICGSTSKFNDNLWSPHINNNINLELGYDIPNKKIMIKKLDFFVEPYSDMSELDRDESDIYENPLYIHYRTINEGIKEDIATLNTTLTYGHGNYARKTMNVIDIAITQPENNSLAHCVFYFDLNQNKNAILDYIIQQINNNLVIDLREQEPHFYKSDKIYINPSVLIPAHIVHSVEVKKFNVIVDEYGNWLKTYPRKRT